MQQITDSIAGCGHDEEEEIGRYLVDLVVKMLETEEKKTAKAQSKSDREKSRVFGICEDMVSVVVDKLMRYDFKTQSEKRWDHIKPLINALYVFSRVRPTFLSKHFVTLQSFIIPLPKLSASISANTHKKERFIKAQINAIMVMSKLAQILTTTIPFVSSADTTKSSYKQLQNAISKLLWGTLNQETVIDTAFESGFFFDLIRTLCSVIVHLSRDYKLATTRLLDMPMGALCALRHDLVWPLIKCKVDSAPLFGMKALVVLGTAIKYFDVESLVKDYQFKQYQTVSAVNGVNAGTGSLGNGIGNERHSVMEKIYEMYIHFMQSPEPRLQRFRSFAVQGFTGLFCREPELMNREETISVMQSFLSLEMADKGRLQCKTLEALHEFFQTEERRTEFLQQETEKGTNKHIQRRHIAASTLLINGHLKREGREQGGESVETSSVKSEKTEDEMQSDGELSDEQEMKADTGINRDVADIRGQVHQSDTGYLIQFINVLQPSIIALCKCPTDLIRRECCRILLDWISSSLANPVELMKHIIALCLDTESKTRDMALAALTKIVERTSALFQMNCIEGIVTAFSLFHGAMNADFISFSGNKETKSMVNMVNINIIGRVLPDNVVRIFQSLEDLTKTERRKTVSAVTRSITNYMADYALCVKREVVGKRNYFAIPLFVCFLCHFLTAMPFETYSSLEPFEIIKVLDQSLKGIGDLKKEMMEKKATVILRMNQIPTDSESIDSIRSKEKELLKALRVLYQCSCQALMMVIIYRFRAFWCSLYHLSDAAISLYKLTTSNAKRDKAKDLKARKQSNGEVAMLFELEMEGKETMAERLKAAYDRMYCQNKVRRPSVNGAVSTRSKKRLQDMEPMYSIPRVLLDIEQEFGVMIKEYTVDFGLHSQTDSEMISDGEGAGNEEEEDDDDVDMNENVECNGKENKKANRKGNRKANGNTKKRATRKQPARRARTTRKTRRRQYISSEEETEEEIEYAETSSGESDSSDSSESDTSESE